MAQYAFWSEYCRRFGYGPHDLRRGCGPVYMVHEGRQRPAVVLVHGLTDSPWFMRAIGEYFFSVHQYHVFLPLLDGHGLHDPRCMKDVHLDGWIANVDEAIDIALRYTTPYPISLGGLSTGGALSVHRALHRQDEVSGALYLFSAALGLAGVLGDMKELFLRSGILCDIVARYEDKSFVERFQDLLFFFGLADEPGAASRLVGDNPYRYRRMDMDGAAQLSELIRQLDSVLRDTVPQQPVFAVHSECDSTAALAPVEELVRRGSGELYRIDRSFGVAHASVVLRDDILSSSDPSRVLEGKNPVFGAMTGALGRFVHETDSSHAS
ncbi:MAG: alpha/beta hydrolase [Prosthecochloris sp.]|jgi:pimeloyl-ACP methyl ester carboxylesterase|nr:alpha/beta hydrolase [Prosthecochloris sp.]